MSYCNRILTAMKQQCIYRPCDLQGATGLPTGEIKKTLDVMAKGGVVETIRGDGYRRKKLYQTKQKSLF